LLWATLGSTTLRRLSPNAVTVLADEDNEIFVSAASAWEIATKVRIGKLPEAVQLEGRFLEAMDEAGYAVLLIDGALALRAGRLVGFHRDPFDRIIAAHAIADDFTVLSSDPQLDAFGIRRIW
jgi:PIN domain nuclease of toxin-antitoxin system